MIRSAKHVHSLLRPDGVIVTTAAVALLTITAGSAWADSTQGIRFSFGSHGELKSCIVDTSGACVDPAIPVYVTPTFSTSLPGYISQPDHTAPISINSATTTKVVAKGAGGTRIRVAYWNLMAGGAANPVWKAGNRTTTECDTNTEVLSGAYPLVANTGVGAGSGLGVVLAVPADKDLCLTTDTSAQVSGQVTYTTY